MLTKISPVFPKENKVKKKKKTARIVKESLRPIFMSSRFECAGWVFARQVSVVVGVQTRDPFHHFPMPRVDKLIPF